MDSIHRSQSEPGSLRWTAHPVRRRPVVSAAVTVFVILVTVVVFYAMDSRTFAVLALVVMLLSLGKFYFPTRYVLDKKGITIKSTTQTLNKEWRLYRSCYPDKNGVLLSPFAEPSRLENFRGLYIMAKDNREEVLVFVKERIRQAVATAVDTADTKED